MAAMARLELLSFLLWAGVAVSSGMDLQKRIIKGDKCGTDDRKYHVALSRIGTFTTIFCGGSLIADQWVLTAAHCFMWGMTAFVNIHPDRQKEQKIEINYVGIYHEKAGLHDIMLLRLTEKPTEVNKIALPADCTNDQNPDPKLNTKVHVAGYGYTDLNPDGTYKEKPPSKFQCTTMTVEDCPAVTQVLHLEHVTKANWICANGPSATAPGDSGGGLEFNKVIHGVISTAPTKPFEEECKFIRVCKYITWINKVMRDNP